MAANDALENIVAAVPHDGVYAPGKEVMIPFHDDHRLVY